MVGLINSLSVIVFSISAAFGQTGKDTDKKPQSNKKDADQGCFVIADHPDQVYRPGDKIHFKISLNQPGRSAAFVSWRNMRLPATRLEYNSESGAFEGDLVVPARLRKDWGLNLDVSVRPKSGFAGSRGTRILMQSGKDFNAPNIAAPIEEARPPIIRNIKATIQQSGPDMPALPNPPIPDGLPSKDAVINLGQLGPRSIILTYDIELQGALAKRGFDKYMTRPFIEDSKGWVLGDMSESGGCTPKTAPGKKPTSASCKFILPLDYGTTGTEKVIIEAGDSLEWTKKVSGQDFPFEVPRTIPNKSHGSHIDSMTAKQLPNGNILVTAVKSGGTSKDVLSVSLNTSGEKSDWESRGAYALGELKNCNSAGVCQGEFPKPELFGHPDTFSLSGSIRQWDGNTTYSKDSGFPIESKTLAGAKDGLPKPAHHRPSESFRDLKLGDVCGIVSSFDIQKGSPAKGGNSTPRKGSGM